MSFAERINEARAEMVERWGYDPADIYVELYRRNNLVRVSHPKGCSFPIGTTDEAVPGETIPVDVFR